MSKVTLTNTWYGYPEPNSGFYGIVYVDWKCNDGTFGSDQFVGENPPPIVIDTTKEEGTCYLSANTMDGRADTESGCNNIAAFGETCAYESVYMDVGVPMLSPLGFAMLVIGIGILAYGFFKTR